MQRCNVNVVGIGIAACGSMLLLSLATLATAQETDPGVSEAAGMEWEMVRGGGGFKAPSGMTGASLDAVTWGASDSGWHSLRAHVC